MGIQTNQITFGDCYELIKQIPDKSVDLIYTDIPYKTGYSKAQSGFKFGGCDSVVSEGKIHQMQNGIDYSILDEFERVLKRMNLFIWCSTKQMADIITHFRKYAPQIIVWHKTNALRMNRKQFISDLEYCLLFRGSGTHYQDTGQFHSRLFESSANTAENKLYKHPTTKPSKLVIEHIRFATQPGDVVLEPFSGSGTTCACAKALGRQYIGFENDEEYYRHSIERLNNIKTGDMK